MRAEGRRNRRDVQLDKYSSASSLSRVEDVVPDSEVAKQGKDLERQVNGAKANGEGLASMADKLDKALADFQDQQIGLGKEMGIQAPAASGGQNR